MELLVHISESERIFLERIARELTVLQKKEHTVEDAVHECIRMAMYEESEETA
ncbi:MAG: hypothetical protein M0024_10220 [Nitrospiraceae bacterium]|nr:hypothetical protein [Nitrospiraceae bacterium]